MTLRRFAPLLISIMLLAALLLLQYARMLDWGWSRTHERDSVTPVLSVGFLDDDAHIVEIYVNVSLDTSRFIRLQELNDQFMAKYPRIQVHLTNERLENPDFDDWLARNERGEASDVMLLDNAMVLPMAVQGYLKSVNSLLVGDAMSDQLAGLLEPLRWNGYLWGVPSHIDPYLLFWNKEMLQSLGISSSTMDFQAIDLAAKALVSQTDGTVEEEAQGYFTNLSAGDFHQLLVWEAKFRTEGTSLIALKGLDESDRAHLQWLADNSSLIAQVPLAQTFKLSELISEDQLLSTVMTWSAYNKLSTKAKDKLILDDEGPLYPWLNGSSYVISANSRNGEEAILWIQEVTNAANHYSAFDETGELPIRASLYGEQAQLVFRSGLMPPLWWYEALSAKAPEGEQVLADPEWPLRWEMREAEWSKHSGEGNLEIAEFAASIPLLE
ncbi:extracellular solute-binding protein [Paenibacillus sp. strain BS8-2]